MIINIENLTLKLLIHNDSCPIRFIYLFLDKKKMALTLNNSTRVDVMKPTGQQPYNCV